MKPTDNEGLDKLLGYFHEDWDLSYGSDEALAVRDFVFEEGREAYVAAIAELRPLLERNDEEIATFIDASTAGIRPENPRAFLERIAVLLPVQAAVAMMAPPPTADSPDRLKVHASFFRPALASTFPDVETAEWAGRQVFEARIEELSTLVREGSGARTWTVDVGREAGYGLLEP